MSHYFITNHPFRQKALYHTTESNFKTQFRRRSKNHAKGLSNYGDLDRLRP